MGWKVGEVAFVGRMKRWGGMMRMCVRRRPLEAIHQRERGDHDREVEASTLEPWHAKHTTHTRF